ncbi:helix-turn-helix domain-containing protein [Streptomyces sp. 184]|uniref:helix-turn-helix domain-containing protein n=1 Tax=Streptomyces sp. 184 TaxID=1827526 RepID=UPI00389274D3
MTTRSLGLAGRMQIARGLTQLRERNGMTQIQVAEEAGVGKSTVSRYETWQDRSRIRWATVRAIADACGASREEREALVSIAKAQDDGWWVGNPAVPEWMDPLVSFEHEATYEHVFANGFVPGLLQTRRYAMAVHEAREVRRAHPEVERMTEARMQRQTILERTESPMHLWVVLDEAVLHRVVGSADVMREQLEHLQEVMQRPNVDIQVLPFTTGAHAAGAGHFVILGRDDEGEPQNSMGIVYIEMRRRGLYLDVPDDVAAYRITFDYLRSQAADTSASARLLGAVRQEISR